MEIAGFTVPLNGWAESLLGSPYLYAAVGCFFACILLITLWHLFRKPQTTTLFPGQSSKAKAQNTDNAADFTSPLIQKIQRLNSKNKIILLAGAGLDNLPVTIPVKIAIAMAQSNRRCLLVDMDTRRNAAAKVFELNSNTTDGIISPYPLKTVIPNLSLWPAEFFVRFSQVNIRTVIQNTKDTFEIIMINAPYLDGHPDRKLIAMSAEYGLIFCQKPGQLDRLKMLLSENGCRLIQSEPVNCPYQ
ncbi:MAG: hypothetical protein ABFD91_04825 [Anaerohalosphaeraceae bacterium]